MAIDQTDKAQNMATKVVTASVKFMDAINELRQLEEERAAAGLTLTDYDADYATGSNKHVDGNALNGVVATSIPAIWTFMTTGSYDDNLQKVLP